MGEVHYHTHYSLVRTLTDVLGNKTCCKNLGSRYHRYPLPIREGQRRDRRRHHGCTPCSCSRIYFSFKLRQLQIHHLPRDPLLSEQGNVHVRYHSRVQAFAAVQSRSGSQSHLQLCYSGTQCDDTAAETAADWYFSLYGDWHCAGGEDPGLFAAS